MMEWYFSVIKIIREMRIKALDALIALEKNKKDGAEILKEYLKKDLELLSKNWPKDVISSHGKNLGRHIGFGELHDYYDILKEDLPGLEIDAEQLLLKFNKNKYDRELGFENLLHPQIEKNAYRQFCDGYYRESVFNAITSVFDLIRERTFLDLDGEKLVNNVFSLDKPKLILSELDTESGKNEQVGFMEIIRGAFRGIRNPKAHSTKHDLNELKAAQYLVFASLLARRVEECKTPENE